MRPSILELVQMASQTLWKPEKPVYEFGSRQVEGGGASDLRHFFKQSDGWPAYVGLDIEAGPGVDVVYEPGEADYTAAGAVLCLEVLEHAADPLTLMRDIRSTLAPGGWALFTTPFSFQIHSRPDYWRITPDGMEALLKNAWFKDYYVFCSEPEHMPVTVAALAWSSHEHDAEVHQFKIKAKEWSAKHAYPLQPHKGDTVLLCPHEGVTWCYLSEPARVSSPDGIEMAARWWGACPDCAGKPFNAALIAKSGTIR